MSSRVTLPVSWKVQTKDPYRVTSAAVRCRFAGLRLVFILQRSWLLSTDKEANEGCERLVHPGQLKTTASNTPG